MSDQINTPAKAEAAQPKAESKSAIVTKLLRRTRGATMDEMMTATTWQAHSIRAFLSGLRKKGNQLAKEQRKSGQLAYRITMPAAAA